MRRNPLLGIIMMVCFSVVFLNGSAHAVDIDTIVQGTVQEIKAGFIKISEGLNGNKFLIATNSNTVYDNAQKLTDLKVGDKVQIKYEEGNNKMIASVITKIDTGLGNNF